MTTNRGIDYGMGTTNINQATGIRFGVIHANDVGQAWYDSAEAYYGEPHCPKCGNEATTVEECLENTEEFERERGACGDYACTLCEYLFDGEDAFGDSPLSWYVNNGEYTAEQGGDDCDIFITSSPYYTRAQFCSPCAPGACHLANPCDDGEKAYCFGHEWFENGVAPYPVYRVSDDSLVTA